MSFTINDERQKYFSARGQVVLNACPGSGKTTSIAHKLKLLICDWKQPGGIACLSFTNVAKDEIAQKYRDITGSSITYPHVVSTIDSFINNNFSLPYAHKIFPADKRFRILDDEDVLNSSFGWDIRKQYGELFYKYLPSEVHCLGNGGFAYGINDNSSKTFVDYAKAIKKYQWKKGLLTSSDSIHFACKVVIKYPRLAKYCAARYPYLIIDEAQDTSSLQYIILESLLNGGLQNLELIGDPYQCLYEWRNASPTLFFE